jgi:CubicO group peptidase (beta-lactamase class C family)
MKIFAGLFLGLIFSTTAWATDLPRATPEEVGLSSERLARLGAYVRQQVDDQQVAGIQILVSRHGKVAFLGSAGMADVNASIPVDSSTIFGLNSMTKPVSSVAVLMLYEQGHFLLTDPVSKHLPELADLQVYVSGEGDEIVTRPAAREMTIQDLLRHTSGLTYGFMGHPQVSAYYRTNEVGSAKEDSATFITKLASAPLIADPGSKWEYSNSTKVLSRLVEVITGQRFDAFLQQHLFEPLGMVDTGYFVEEDEIDRLSARYEKQPDGSLKQYDKRADRYATEPVFFAGDSGLVSTAADYFRFAQMLLNGGEIDGVRILSPATVDFMTKNQIPGGAERNFMTPPWLGFGLGVSIVLDSVAVGSPTSAGSYSWAGTASCNFWVDPQEDLVVIILTQIYPTRAFQLRAEVEALVYQAIIAD